MKETEPNRIEQISIKGRKACDEFIAIIKEEAKEMEIEVRVAMLVSGMVPMFNEKGERITDYKTIFKNLNMPKSENACEGLVRAIYLEVLEEDTEAFLKCM